MTCKTLVYSFFIVSKFDVYQKKQTDPGVLNTSAILVSRSCNYGEKKGILIDDVIEPFLIQVMCH